MARTSPKTAKSRTSKPKSTRANTQESKSAKATPETNRKMSLKMPKINLKGINLRSIKENKKLLKTLGWVLVVIAAFVLVDYFVQYLNNGYSIAVVNGERISHREYAQRLEEVAGEKTAQNLIDTAVIEQEAAKEKITVDDNEVDDFVQKAIDELGSEQAYKDALEANGLTDEIYRRDLKVRLLAQKLVVDKPDEKTLKDFFTQYKAVYFSDSDKYDDVKTDVEQLYYNQQFNENYQSWLDEKETDAVIQNNYEDNVKYAFLKVTRNIVQNLFDDLKSKK
ncbi:SurA N-terminal domain-containing protein [Candidatus Nomurabacteria bacterium]|nr:SurA N-terminal domain-containing protein [Candidatus Nomurabacteria bacterium]